MATNTHTFKDIPNLNKSEGGIKGFVKNINSFIRPRHSSLVWMLERLTSILLIPFVLWFILIAINTVQIYSWDRELLNGFVMLTKNVFSDNPFMTFTLFTILLIHIRLGIHAVIEDYVHTEVSKKYAMILLDIICLSVFLDVIF